MDKQAYEQTTEVKPFLFLRIFDKYIPSFVREFLKFLGVGAVNTVVCFVLIFFFHSIFGFHYMIANFLGYFITLVFGYTAHYNITFRSRKIEETDKKSKAIKVFKRFRKFSMVFTISYLVQLGCLYVMVSLWHFWFLPAQIIAIGIYIVISYLGNSLFTFKKE